MNLVVKLAASALPGEKKYIFFAGAGISKDAGIPTAWDLMLKTAGLLYAADSDVVDPNVNLEEWFIRSKYAQMEYSELIEKVYPNYPDQQNFLKEYLNNHEIGHAHRGIAELARRGIIRAVITTNFDHYIEKALEEKRLGTQVISTDEDLKNSEPLIHCKSVRIYKPHGDLGHGALKNTPKDLEKLSPLMERELTRVLSEHGVIVLGYSGRDKGIQKIFKERNYSYYPLFWVNPSPPEGEIEDVLKTRDYTYIPCTGAGQFIDDFLRLLERLKDLAPTIGSGPTISDLKYALSSSKEPIAPLYAEYLKNMFSELERTKPDFSKFAEYDEAIVAQIKEGIPISYRFIEAALLASKYGNVDAITAIYGFFASALKLYDIPDDFSGSYRSTDFDGYKFLVYEMFVSFIAALIKYDNWGIIGDILTDDLFLEKKYDSKYVSFTRISSYVASLDEIRNKRLNLRRISVMGDLFKERFTQSELSQLVTHKDFLEADYFLFMRTVCHEDNLESLWNVWCPRSCVWLDGPPSYIVKAESKRFLEKIAKATGFEKSEEFVENFKRSHSVFTRYFSRGWKGDPLEHFDLNKIGTRR
jgi:hypothetical protein